MTTVGHASYHGRGSRRRRQRVCLDDGGGLGARYWSATGSLPSPSGRPSTARLPVPRWPLRGSEWLPSWPQAIPVGSALGVSVGYDAGALVAAQVSRLGRQAQLGRFLRGCEVEPFRPEDAHEVGALAGKAAVNDVVDVHVVVVAHRRRFGVVTSDAGDLRPIADALGTKVPLLPV